MNRPTPPHVATGAPGDRKVISVFLVLLTQLSLLMVTVQGISWPLVGGVMLFNVVMAYLLSPKAPSIAPATAAPPPPRREPEAPVAVAPLVPDAHVLERAEETSDSARRLPSCRASFPPSCKVKTTSSGKRS